MSEAITGAGAGPGYASLSSTDEYCDICGAAVGRLVIAREMMFGLRDVFRYWECDACGCVRLVDVPTDMSRHYPPNYYSYRPADAPLPPPRGRFRRWAFSRRNLAIARGDGGAWGFIARMRPRPDFATLEGLLQDTNVRTPHARILEVGCGNGHLLRLLASAGFDSLLGVDPFIREEVHSGESFRIEAKTVFDVTESGFDLILFHHSLEHMQNQIETLTMVRRLLGTNGVCKISIPIAGSDPWRRYREKWIELDAPRHLYLHSAKSLAIAAKKSGLSISTIRSEGDIFAYWGSELYGRDISLRDGDATRRPEDYFDQAQLDDFRRQSQKANLDGTAGRASFVLEPNVDS